MNDAAPPPAPRRLLPLAEVEKRIGLRKTAIYARIGAGSFPRPVMLGASARWVESEVDGWIADQIAARDAGGKAA